MVHMKSDYGGPRIIGPRMKWAENAAIHENIVKSAHVNSAVIVSPHSHHGALCDACSPESHCDSTLNVRDIGTEPLEQ